MPLKFKAKSKEEIPSELQALYVEREGAFVLDVEGAVDKARVDEFRESSAVSFVCFVRRIATLATKS